MFPIEDNKSGKEKIAPGFHNARCIYIYDSKTKILEIVSTASFSAKPGDFSKQIQQLGVSSVISTYMPPFALRVFARSGLDAYKARGNSVQENICFFINNQLESFSNESVRETWGCQSNCGSCGSTSCN